jgi:aspartyl-tRNA(Asn)/glutamyl-tRNA(Gln) amidotransferase subunit A
VSARELCEDVIARIERDDGALRSFTFVDPELLLKDADALDGKLNRGEGVGQLAGVTIGVKDLIDVRGMPTSYNSPTFAERTPSADAECVRQLRAADALIVGKTRSSEFAWSPDTPPTVNPADHLLTPCGSSGGSAAAVGGSLVHAGLGTDTGGSIRAPAALCGLVGIKPTYGVVSLTGVLPNSWSLDHAGPLTRSVDDARLVLRHMVSYDRRDPAGAPADVVAPLRRRLDAPTRVSLGTLRIGVFDHPLFEIVEDRAQAAFEGCVERLSRAGAAVVSIDLPELRFVLGTLLAINMGDAGVFTRYLRGRLEQVAQADVQAALHLAHAVPAVLVSRAQQARRRLAELVSAKFREHRLDAVLTPASVAGAIARDEPDAVFTRSDGEEEPVLWWGYPRPFYLANLTGLPAVVLPIATDPPPLGLQLIGKPYLDDELLAISDAFAEEVVA